MLDKKTVKFEYKNSHRPMGVFAIRNLLSDGLFIAPSMNLPGSFNRHKFQLISGVHARNSLQTDWNDAGEESFEFEILEVLPPRIEPSYDHAGDFEVLEDLWLEKFEPYGEKGYNVRKKTREERLRMIAQNRK